MLEIFGGPDRDRTDDLFHAMEARSQLRHRPTCRGDATPLLSPLGRDSVKPGRWTELRVKVTQGQESGVTGNSSGVLRCLIL